MSEMPTFNDLVGLPYRWGARPQDGATDCFQLACEALRRRGCQDYSFMFEWVYERYDEGAMPRSLLYRLLRSTGWPLVAPAPGVVGFHASATHGALSTVTEHGLLLVGPAQRVVHLSAAAAPTPDRFFLFR